MVHMKVRKLTKMPKIVEKCPYCDKIARTIKSFKDEVWGGLQNELACGHILYEELASVSERDEMWANDARQYQRECVEFIEQSNFNCLIADDMGLGKTVETALTIRYNSEKLLPCIIVVKPALIYQWAIELQKWLGNGRIIPIQMLTDGASVLLPGMKYYILSNCSLHKYIKQIEALQPKLLVIDESHHFKDTNSQRTQALVKIANAIPHRICTSGTPILNNASEYFTTLNLIAPTEWYSKKSYQWHWLGQNNKGQYTFIRPRRRLEFLQKTQSYIIRRTREEVLSDLPGLSRNFIYVTADNPTLSKEYAKIVNQLRQYLETSAGELAFTRNSNIMAYFSKLRQMAAIMKAPEVISRVNDYIADGKTKLTVAVHHHVLGNMLVSAFSEYNPIVLRGGMSALERHEAQQEFQRDDRQLLIASLLSAGEGLNLQFCHNAIIAERWWNHFKELQFEGRFHRFGQQNHVQIDYLLLKGFIDEYVTQLIEAKKVYTKSALQDEFREEDIDENVAGVDILELANMIVKAERGQ